MSSARNEEVAAWQDTVTAARSRACRWAARWLACESTEHRGSAFCRETEHSRSTDLRARGVLPQDERLRIQNRHVDWSGHQIAIPAANTKDAENRRSPFGSQIATRVWGEARSVCKLQPIDKFPERGAGQAMKKKHSWISRSAPT